MAMSGLFLMVTSGRRVLLACRGWRPEVFLNTLQCKGWPPTTKKDPIYNGSSAKVEKSCIRAGVDHLCIGQESNCLNLHYPVELLG